MASLLLIEDVFQRGAVGKTVEIYILLDAFHMTALTILPDVVFAFAPQRRLCLAVPRHENEKTVEFG